jgi:hypothetical protein
MRTPFLSKFLPPSSSNISFSEFIDFLELLPTTQLQEFAYRHASLQSQPYERYVYTQQKEADKANLKDKVTPIFHEIVKVENMTESLRRIYEKTGLNYSFSYNPRHFSPKIQHSIFVGTMSWDLVKNQIPYNYGLFYNEKIKEKVKKIFYWDLLLYNYSFEH